MKRFFLITLLTACATQTPEQKVDIPVYPGKTTPSNKVDFDNACDIYSKNPQWLTDSLQASQKWQVPIFIMLAIIHQESRFKANARPLNKNPASNKKFASSAYGYSQALDGTWREYQQKTGNLAARRNDFQASVDFIGWYTAKSHRINGVSKWAADQVYLNYHEGHGGYKRQTYINKQWLLKVAQKVKKRSLLYATQLKKCGIPLYLEEDGRVPDQNAKTLREITAPKGNWF